MVVWVWRRGRQWSALANARSRAITSWRWGNLTLILVGALLGALATQQGLVDDSASTVLGAVGGTLLAVAAIVQSRFLGGGRVQERVTARVASESVKAAVFRYLAGVPPYDGPDRDAALEAELADLTAKAGPLAAAAVDAKPDAEPVPAVTDIAGYVRERALDQQEFHAERKASHRRQQRRWRAAEFVATVAAAGLSAFGSAGTGPDLTAWVGVATTVAAAIAAHLAGEQHARIAASYTLTADDLDQLIRDFDPATAGTAAAAEFVGKVEAVLARQNQTWVSTLAQQA